VIAADTSSLVAYLSGDTGADVRRVDEALVSGELRLPPVVVTELLSDATARSRILGSILDSPMLDVLPDYWIRAGATRAAVLATHLRARLPGALIAQSCIDHDVALITRDDDFRHFEKHCGLKLA
jgi:predicted nucleic acid-binding protein